MALVKPVDAVQQMMPEVEAEGLLVPGNKTNAVLTF